MHWLTTFDPKTLGNSVAGDPQTRTMFNSSCVVGVTLLTFKNDSPETLADHLSDFARGLPRKSCVPLLMRSSWCPTYRRSYWKASVKGPMQDCAVPFAWWHLDCGECCIGSHRNTVEELRIGIFGDLFFIYGYFWNYEQLFAVTGPTEYARVALHSGHAFMLRSWQERCRVEDVEVLLKGKVLGHDSTICSLLLQRFDVSTRWLLSIRYPGIHFSRSPGTRINILILHDPATSSSTSSTGFWGDS